VESSFQAEEVKQKIKQTCLKKYGVENVSQNSEIMEKITKKSFSRKEFIFPSGKKQLVQGYEHFALNDILNIDNIEENDVIIGAKNVPNIWYNDDNNKLHRHYVDIFIQSKNLCIEVKSTWTIIKPNVFIKQNAAKKLGYNYEIWLYSPKGEKINCFK
jgi:hypothetical protein